MVRSELITALAERFPQLPRAGVDSSVTAILVAVANTLSSGGRVEIRGFGSFTLTYRPPRIGRNPATGAPVEVRGTWRPHFKPGRVLRELIDVEQAQ